jgi:hypothetical protein
MSALIVQRLLDFQPDFAPFSLPDAPLVIGVFGREAGFDAEIC